jgi:hypothetical protein
MFCSAGFINIRADAVPNTCCGSADYLFLYKSATPNGTPVITGNGIVPGVTATGTMNLDFSEKCNLNDVYWLCEKTGVIITSSIKATLTNQPTGVTSCPLVTGQTVTPLFCQG